MSVPPRLSVIGTGYLGATHAVCMVELGYEVIGLDVDKAKIDRLIAGEVPFFEPELPELLKKHIDGGRLRFTTSYAEAAEFADVHFVCVGTPQRAGELAADMTYVEAAFASLAPHLTRKVLVVGKSTVPAGTAVRMEEVLHDLAPCPDVELAWNPEFLREGFAVQDTLRPDRLVMGVHSEWAEQQLRATFEPVIAAGTPVVVTDFATAELVKVAANSFLATKISFINAMAEVCETTGADVTKLADAIGYDARIGRRFLNAGLGFGGGCLPKDIRAFIARAGELGVDQAVSFLHEVDSINLRRRARTVDIGLDLLDGSYRGARVAALGAAFKPNSDDVRESPALDVASAIARREGTVVVYDPEAVENARRSHPELTYVASLEDALDQADIVFLLTEWDEFKNMHPGVVGKLVAQRNIVDGRNVLDPLRWRAAGWQYRALGRP
ncbi:MAG: UDPglucose 6-dehydrogenase [Pseudonocardiales bacterium]|jgi:UDPglucose 6-dehydrogenase|nr:ugd [Jatrophihabitans sp.]MDT4900231.1 UDPglucose 6-dehydrogenase [Pseudonocardiales bacterium]MDT4927961.1 UDPglucose 6-dehydrogenase [Pseudonocardiales bacterium]